MAELQNLVSRLEAVTARLEKCASSSGKTASAVDDDEEEYGELCLMSL